ncbi:hypothetical protein EDB19DRAFT_1912348 [Suillus lakei]|nr:hypothetical protein EDB19DRAFT_1912348 [Suillus lakei]
MLAKLQKHTYDFSSRTEFEEDRTSTDVDFHTTQVANSTKTPPAHPNIIDVQVGLKEQNEVIPAELCLIAPDQCYTHKLPPKFLPSMVKSSSKNPQDPAELKSIHDEAPYWCLLSPNFEANKNEPYMNLLSSDPNVDHTLCLLSIIKNGAPMACSSHTRTPSPQSSCS